MAEVTFAPMPKNRLVVRKEGEQPVSQPPNAMTLGHHRCHGKQP